MTRSVVEPEQASANSERPGSYTFNAPVLNGYEGHTMTFGCVRIGDHAHIHVHSGRAALRRNGVADASMLTGFAGKLLLRWPEWILLRTILDADPRVWIAEVECPTRAMAERYASDRPPSLSPAPTEAL